MKKKKLPVIAVLVLALLLAITVPVAKSQGVLAPGNGKQYSVDRCETDPNSPLQGKTVLFLGSSVTYGSAAKGESFVDFLEKKDGITAVKEAVSGTTLTDTGDDSYVARIKTMDTSLEADAFVCQLSTNDASKNKPLGTVDDHYDIDAFDTKTVAGAIEYITAYAYRTWGCPVIFYTGTKYDSRNYEKMIDLLYELQQKWQFTVLDLWHDEDMNRVTKKEYRLYMANGIHPTRAGYRDWWLPKFETALASVM